MKKWKFYVTIAVLVVMVALLSFSVYAAMRSYSGVVNKTEFITGDENVFVRIDASYDGPDPTATGAQKTFFYELNRSNENAYKEQSIIPAWTLGATNFVAHEKETITFVFNITNNNQNSDLDVTLTNIAADFEQKFTTTYYIYNFGTEPESGTLLVPEEQNQKTMNAEKFTLAPKARKIVKVEFKLRSYAKDFNFENSMKFVFQTPTETAEN